MENIQNIENFLAAYDSYEGISALAESGDFLRIKVHDNGSYEPRYVPIPDANRPDFELAAELEGKVRRIGRNFDLIAVPAFDFIGDEQHNITPQIRGVEIEHKIYAANTKHMFKLYFKELPVIKARSMEQFYHGMPFVGADHPKGGTYGHIRIRQDGKEKLEADFFHHGFEKEFEFFVQMNGVYRLAAPIDVPKASLRDKGALTHLLQMLQE